MGESHSKGEQRHIPLATAGDGRSAMARASDGRPPKFYDPARDRAEPPAVTAARKRHQALNDEIERRREAMPDPAPGYEWHQELTCDG